MTSPAHPNGDVLLEYLTVAPAALAIERAVEARLYVHVPLERPILDLGCGDGTFATIAFPGGLDAGLDPDPDELAVARSTGAYGELLECRGDEIPRPDGSFRTIVSNSVLEHIPDLDAVLREAHRVLAPRGRLYATVPTERFESYSALSQLLQLLRLAALTRRWHRFYNRFWKHFHAHPVGEWRARAESAGFRVVAAETYAPRRMCLIDDLLAPFGLPAKIRKGRTGRWVAGPRLRRPIAALAARLLRPLLEGAERAPAGGLVFLTLERA